MKNRLFSLALAGALSLSLVLPVGAAGAAASEDQAIQTVNALGIMVGDRTGSMDLSRSVTRAEFVTMALKAMGRQIGQAASSPYPDVPWSHWAAGYVEAGVAAGLVSGYSDGRFRPSSTITLAEGVTIALRLLDYRHCETVILLQEQREYFQGEMEKLRRSVPSLPKPKTFVPGRGPKAYEGAEPYCFVSYAHINSNRVYPIVEQLMQRGIRLWYDDGIEAGRDFREFIAEKIRDSWQVLLFASHESIQPGFVRNEINYALHCGKPILRVNLDDVELTPGMELSLGGMQYVDATEPGGDYLERIVRTLLAERKEKA